MTALLAKHASHLPLPQNVTSIIPLQAKIVTRGQLSRCLSTDAYDTLYIFYLTITNILHGLVWRAGHLSGDILAILA